MIDELTCQELVELVTDHLEGRLAPDDEVRFLAHLAECDGCESYVEQMRTVIHVTGTLTEASLPPPAVERLLGAFRGWHGRRA